MKRIVLFVEGEGEAEAAPVLVNKLVNEIPNARNAVFVDPKPFRVGEINKLMRKKSLGQKILSANKRTNVGGILILLDGDIRKIQGHNRCLVEVAKQLADQVAELGGGTLFSVAFVFALQEFESWLIASFDSMRGNEFPDGRRMPAEAELPDNVEISPRDAKGWLTKTIEDGYRPTRDQAQLTRWLDIDTVKAKNLRSFQRLESAVNELVTAIQKNQHVATPSNREQ